MKVSPHLAAPRMSPVQQPLRQGRAQCLLGNPRVRTESGGREAWRDPDRGADLCSCCCLTAVPPPSARRRGSWGPLCCGRATSCPCTSLCSLHPTAAPHAPTSLLLSLEEGYLFLPSGPAALPVGSCTFAEMLVGGEREEGWPMWHPAGSKTHSALCPWARDLTFLGLSFPLCRKGRMIPA